MTVEQEKDFADLTCIAGKVQEYCKLNNCMQAEITLKDAIILAKDYLSDLEVAHINGENWENWEMQDRSELRKFLEEYEYAES